jgi:hypothetical protein
MSAIKPPNNFDFSRPSEWSDWIRRYKRYHTVAKLGKEDDLVQIDTLLYVMGETAENVFDQLSLSDDDRKNYDEVLAAFETYFTPKKNVAQYVVQFNSREQNQHETNEEYIRALYSMAQKCEFGGNRDTNIKYRLLTGMTDKHLSIELQQVEDNKLTLDLIVNRMRSKEIVEQTMKTTKDVAAAQFARQTNYTPKSYTPANTNGDVRAKSTDRIINNCSRCGRKHAIRRCPAYQQTCKKCGKRNHFATVCKTTVFNPVNQRNNKMVHATEAESYAVNDTTFNIGEISNVSADKSVWFTDFSVNGRNVTFKVDTGAQVNIINDKVFDGLCSDAVVRKSDSELKGYTGDIIPVRGVVDLPFVFRGRHFTSEFYISSAQNHSLIGFPTSRLLGLVQVDQVGLSNNVEGVLVEFSDIFTGLGKLDTEHHITVESGAVPIVSASRPVPVHVRPKLKAELDRLENLGIIQKCDEPTEWVSPIVIVPKPNGQIRICLDPRNLNKVIKREHFKIPTTQEIFSRVTGSEYFSTLDATNGFHQIPLDEESSKLVCFLTPFGRFVYKRLPFGLNSSAEVFHKSLVSKLGDIAGVEIYIDDLLIHHPTKEGHDKILKTVLERCRQINLKLNKEKSCIGKTKVNFLGHELSGDGLAPKRERASAIKDMLEPRNKNDVQRFLGFVNYLGKFCPGLAEHTEPLRTLLRKKTEFMWEKPQIDAFGKIKELVVNSPVLKHFEPDKPVTLQVDASSHSLGATIMQDGQPVEYATKALTDTQKRYAQIEKELLGVLFGCKKFHYYIYGGPQITIQTDHKPLIGIMNKNIEETTPRIRRMLTELSAYSFQLVYQNGKEMYVADMLSRAEYQKAVSVESIKARNADDMSSVVEIVFSSETKKQEYIQATANDTELQALVHLIEQGWPRHRKSCSEIGRKFWNWRDDISVCQNLLFMGSRLIVPLAKQAEILKKLHESHAGLSKTNQLAKAACTRAYNPTDLPSAEGR